MDDINDYVPSILRPKSIRKAHGSLTQSSIFSHLSLSLKKNNNSVPKLSKAAFSNKENVGHNNVVPSQQHNKCKAPENDSLLQFLDKENDVTASELISFNDLDLKNCEKPANETCDVNTVDKNKENLGLIQNNKVLTQESDKNKVPGNDSLPRFSDIDDIRQDIILTGSEPFSFNDLDLNDCDKATNVSSKTELYKPPSESEEKSIYEEKPVISLTFSVKNCDKVDISSNKSNIKRLSLKHVDAELNVDCEIIEGSELSVNTEAENTLQMDGFRNEPNSPQKRKAAAVNLEIKKQKLTAGEQSTEKAKVLILKTNAIERISHVIVQPPNYKLVKRKIPNSNKGENGKRKSLNQAKNNVISLSGIGGLKQKSIDSYFKSANVLKTKRVDESAFESSSSNDYAKVEELVRNDAQEMNKNSAIVGIKHDARFYKSHRNESSTVPPQPQQLPSPQATLKASMSDVPRIVSPRSKKESTGSLSPRKNAEFLQFNLPLKSKSNKNSISGRCSVPHYKIVAGTHFAVDAFSYGDIPNVKHYFLTHFHSDHYSGLKKSFNKLLLCSKLTADLCTSRLGVNPKCIKIINIDETLKVEGVEVAVVDANHCPGAVMLVFTLPNGKSQLHTGDFRASPAMESYPVLWNKDIHTVYLDTTYCNPRYDFPTQDESLEMALYLLRKKKMALEKAGKKFSSVLIVCGTYTIGKEKFFLGMARRVGCSVWACPEKDRVLQAVEGHSFSHSSPQSCQLHVVPMRDLTHERLRSYLDSMNGTFNEVVAFKPSGWENGKNSSIEKDSVTIHGIPYSEHSSFSELIRFVKFLKPKQVIPTVDISGGIKAVQKYFPCPLVNKDDIQCQSKLTDFFSKQSRLKASAVT